MKAWACERVLFLAVVFVAPLLYLAWQAFGDPRIEFLVPSANADWALHPHQGVLDMHGTPVSRDLVFRKSFSLREIPTHLILRYRAFTDAALELNGKRLDAPPPASWKRSAQIDLSPGLRPGQNTLTVRVHNPGAVPALLVTSPASLRTATGWQVALDTTPEATAAAATPWTNAPRSYLFFRDPPSPLVQSVGRPLLDVLVGAWLAALGALGALGAWTWWRRDSTRASAPAEKSPGVGASKGVASAVVLALSLAFQLTNAFDYPAERSFVDSRDHADYVQQTARSWQIPSARDGFQMYQPPAYYWVSAVVYRLAGGDAREDRALKAVQVVGALAGFSLVLLTWLLARRFFADEGSRATATAFAACLPMLLYTSPTVSNETFAAAAAGLAFYALARRDALASARRVAVAGVCCGLALLSKYSGLFVAVAGMLLLLRPRGARSPGDGAPARTGASWIRWRPLAIFTAVVLLLSGWLYLRNLAEFGDPFIGNWDEGSGFHYEQDPGYRSLGFYAGFGRVFTEPIEHAPWLSFWDGVYGTLWADVYRSFLNPADDRVKFWVAISLLLAAWPSLLLLLGFADTLGRALRRPFADAELLLVSVPVWNVAALLSFTLEVPFYSTIKAFFVLSLAPILAIYLVRGRGMLAVAPRSLRVAGDLVLIALALLNLALYRYIPEP